MADKKGAIINLYSNANFDTLPDIIRLEEFIRFHHLIEVIKHCKFDTQDKSLSEILRTLKKFLNSQNYAITGDITKLIDKVVDDIQIYNLSWILEMQYSRMVALLDDCKKSILKDISKLFDQNGITKDSNITSLKGVKLRDYNLVPALNYWHSIGLNRKNKYILEDILVKEIGDLTLYTFNQILSSVGIGYTLALRFEIILEALDLHFNIESVPES